MSFQIFDTLLHNDTELKPLRGKEVNLYSCGPTVYNHAHIGNLRAYIFADILYKTLRFSGFEPNWVMNITDVDDKTIHNTIEEFGSEAGVVQLKKFTSQFTRLFLADIKKTGVAAEQITFVNVSDVITQIQEFILTLLEKGYAYKSEDGVFFSIEKYQNDFGDYGVLVGQKFMEGKKIGARVKVDEYDKENLSDFALWKAWDPSDGNIFWDHPVLGKGRPGWHIECTVINYLNFPVGTDLHTGGVDLMFPHHTNEIAQAQPVYKPFVCHWAHSEHILVDNQKMSKSVGNFYTLADLEEQHIASGLDLRFLYLQTHYRTRLNVTKESLTAAKNGLRNIHSQVARLKDEAGQTGKLNEDILAQFRTILNKDLNTPLALGLISKVLDSKDTAADKLATLYEMDKVLSLGLTDANAKGFADENQLDEETRALLQKRNQAREDKNFALSDQLRIELEEKGYKVLDTSEGTKLEKI